jgi:hypothetical protein
VTRVARDLRWRQADGVRRWAKLNARQIGLLQTIAVGEGDLREAWSEVAPSALALQNRGLVNSQGPLARGGLSSPTGGGSTSNTVTIPTDPATACRALAPRRGLRMGEPSAREMSTGLQASSVPDALPLAMELAVVELLERLEDGGGNLRITEPDHETRSWWRRAIHAATVGGRVPDGHHLRHHGRNRGDLVIELIKGEHPGARYWQRDKESPRVAVLMEDNGEIDPLARQFVDSPRAGMSKDAAARAERLVTTLVGAAKQRGHLIQIGAEPVSALTIEVDGCAFGLTMFEECQPVERVQLPSEPDAPKLYDWQRVKPEVVHEPTGRLVIEFTGDDWAYRGRRRRWGDTKRWRLDDKLGEVLAEVEARAALLKERRRAEEEAKARRQQQWEEAMQLARSRYYDTVRGDASGHRSMRGRSPAGSATSVRTSVPRLPRTRPPSGPQSAAPAPPWAAATRSSIVTPSAAASASNTRARNPRSVTSAPPPARPPARPAPRSAPGPPTRPPPLRRRRPRLSRSGWPPHRRRPAHARRHHAGSDTRPDRPPPPALSPRRRPRARPAPHPGPPASTPTTAHEHRAGGACPAVSRSSASAADGRVLSVGWATPPVQPGRRRASHGWD